MMNEQEIRELRKQGIRLRIGADGPPKSIQAGRKPLPGQSVVLVKGAKDVDEARRIYAAFLQSEDYSDAELQGLRKTAPQTFLGLLDAIDRVVVEVR